MAHNAATILQTPTNHGGKRKGEDTDGALSKKAKKLKSHTRTMSMADAKNMLADSDSKLKIQNKIIREKQKEIRELKKQLEAAEDCMARAKAAKSKIESQNLDATKMVKSDADLIIQKVEDAAGKSDYSVGHVAINNSLGKDTMEDMISLGNGADILRLAGSFLALLNPSASRSRQSALRGAIQSAMAAQSPQQEIPALAKALRMLYLSLLKCRDVHTCYETLPLVASAMNIGANGMQDADEREKDYDLLSSAVHLAVDQMKMTDSLNYGRYRSSEDKCPIIDLLFPIYNAIEHESGGAAKAILKETMKKALIESVNKVESATDYAMPAEAAIAGKKGFPEMQRFLLSPTETSLSLDLSKTGRMAVHGLIDNNMDCRKLSHTSEGFGHERCLIIRKSNAEPPEMIQKRKERKQKHNEMLLSMGMYNPLVITLPPPNTRLGITLDTNTELGLPELKGVATSSPILSQIPEQFQKDCCIASLKSDAIGLGRPKNAQDCVKMISKSMQSKPMLGKIEIVFVPLKDT